MQTKTAASVFFHKNNITEGAARLIWATTTQSQDAGWICPGGRRITDRFEAMALASRMNQLIQQNTLR